MPPPPPVVAIGHAIVDVLARCDDSELARLGLQKGTMTLVDDPHAAALYAAIGPVTEASGGSAANTAACLASLGTAVRFVGKVADDALGKVFTEDIRAAGVEFDPPAPVSSAGPGTGRCLVLVAPDAEKTMCTCLGIGAGLRGDDVDTAAIRAAKVLYLEGYMCGKPESADGVEAAVTAARSAGTLVAFSGSDPAWVEGHRSELTDLLERVDILFANEPEALLLSGCADIDRAVDALARRCGTVAVTLGEAGSVVTGTGPSGEVARVRVPAADVSDVVDTTGAGDSFAAGFLHGVVRDLGLERSARLGSLAAGEIVGHMGARPLTSLASLAEQSGLA